MIFGLSFKRVRRAVSCGRSRPRHAGWRRSNGGGPWVGGGATRVGGLGGGRGGSIASSQWIVIRMPYARFVQLQQISVSVHRLHGHALLGTPVDGYDANEGEQSTPTGHWPPLGVQLRFSFGCPQPPPTQSSSASASAAYTLENSRQLPVR